MKKTLEKFKSQSVDITCEARSNWSRKRLRAFLKSLDVPVYTKEELQLFLLFVSDGEGDIWEKYDRLWSHVEASNANKRLNKRHLRPPSPHYFFALSSLVRQPVPLPDNQAS
ncbi:hypothetical protein [Rhizobium binae]|uniref:hypothetical protein n=1 Tax=Rhizobium binae TaxID=1138190 RepID=UPI001C8392AA|nr:hypothetical protein [Rhizobium binae]MBX4963678.1 hypothetical protein [Rhizobium binae]